MLGGTLNLLSAVGVALSYAGWRHLGGGPFFESEHDLLLASVSVILFQLGAMRGAR